MCARQHFRQSKKDMVDDVTHARSKSSALSHFGAIQRSSQSPIMQCRAIGISNVRHDTV